MNFKTILMGMIDTVEFFLQDRIRDIEVCPSDIETFPISVCYPMQKIEDS